jgi:multidrug efflux pump subunit AcrA (membrane-fusion protein)
MGTALAAALAGCGGDKNKKAATEEAATVFAVSTTTATRGELKDYLEFGGDVTAKTNVDILPDTAGRIAEVKVHVGDYVEKNQIIALVDASRAGMNYELGPVKAPISGTITAVNVVQGSMVSQAMSVARVSKTEALEISMNVPERFISKIRADQQAYLRFDAYPGEVFPARTSEVSPVLDQSSRTMSVKLSLVKPDERIKAGMFARVKLITDTRSGIVKIPEAAIVSRFGETFVFVVEPAAPAPATDPANGETADAAKAADTDAIPALTVRKQPVKAGIRVDDKIEILSGLSAGDEIVVRGQTLLENGSLINIVSRLEPLPQMETSK